MSFPFGAPFTVSGLLTGLVATLAHEGKTKAAFRAAKFCGCLALIPLILLYSMTRTYGIDLEIWLGCTPFIIWGWFMNWWSKRLRLSS